MATDCSYCGRVSSDNLGNKLGRRVTTALGGLLDSALLRAMQIRPPQPSSSNLTKPPKRDADRRAQLEEAAEFYARPDIEARYFAAPAPLVRVSERPVRRLADGEVVDLAFPSAWEVLWDAARDDYQQFGRNDTVHARLLRHHRTASAVAVCIHGYRGGNFFLEERAFAARYFYEQGMDVALMTLPFHALRAHDGPIRWPGPNIGRLNEGFGQAMSDLRALIAWLRKSRPGARILVMGMSLGGYSTALYSTIEPAEFSAPIIPVASMADLFWDWGKGGSALRQAERDGVTLELLRRAMKIHSPLERRPKNPPDRMLVVVAHGDRIAPPSHGERLAAHFGCDEIRFPGGHLLQFGRDAAFDELLHRAAGVGVLQR